MNTQSINSMSMYDAIVVGSGAGGAAAVYRLVRAGMKVLLVDKGGSLPTDGRTLDVQRVVHDGEFKSREDWEDGQQQRFRPEEYFNIGGKTKWYGAALARFSAAEFRAEPTYQCLGWPIAYDDLEPYYGIAEQVLGVRQFACEADLEKILKNLHAASAGWIDTPLPIALREEIRQHPNEAMHFDGFASPLGLKGDAERTFLAAVHDHTNLVTITDNAVVDLVPDPRQRDRVVGVQLRDGSVHRAKTVLLGAGALHSPRLVQRYLRANDLLQLPLAKVAGTNFKLHLLTAVLAVSTGIKRDQLRKTRLLTNQEMPHSSVQPLGFDGELLATLIPSYAPRLIARLIGQRAYGFFLQTEDGSSVANQVMASANENGLPRLDYDATRLPAALAEHRRLVSGFRRAMFAAGYINFAQRIGLQGTAHACGTLVTGRDANTSAVDDVGRVHGLQGLMVVDGSVLPRSSRVNPALTIYAFGLRAAEQLTQRWQIDVDRAVGSVDAAPRTTAPIA